MAETKCVSFQKPLFVDMDGAIDDMTALIALLTIPEFRVTGIALTEGCTYKELAIEAALKICSVFCRNDIQIARSNSTTANPFPEKWRGNIKKVAQLPILQDYKTNPSQISETEAADFTAHKILNEEANSTILLTGPATNLCTALEKYPEIIPKIDNVLWMAGAFLTNGNVIVPDHDGSAEWNIFWDPVAARNLLKSGLKITLFPLDATSQVPIDNYIMYHLKEQSNFKLSKLMYDLFEITYGEHGKLYMSDLLPALYLASPGIVRFSNTSIDIEQRGTSVGNLFKTSKGYPIRFATCVDDENYYTALIDILRQF
jgi:purine nucleosidase